MKIRIKLLFINLIQKLRVKEKVRYPNNPSMQENIGFNIFNKLLKQFDTLLDYDYKTQECYLISKKYNIDILLESKNLKIITIDNVYDIKISNHMESYILDKILVEMLKRRLKFKNELLEKVNHSLDNTLKDLNDHDKSK